MSTLLTPMIVMPKATKKPAKPTTKKIEGEKGRDYALDEGAASIGPLRASGVDEPSEKPVMIAARVHPKLQYGLRLLSRVQGGTIAEALEWAINLAMRSTRIGSGTEETRLYKVVQQVWDKPTEPRQIFVLDNLAPELLDFEQRAAWNLVLRCRELWIEGDPDYPEGFPNFDVIERHWIVIRETGVFLGRAGEIENRYELDEILNGKAIERAVDG